MSTHTVGFSPWEALSYTQWVWGGESDQEGKEERCHEDRRLRVGSMGMEGRT